MAPVRANIASRRVVLPLWKGPTSAMHRGPRGLLTSCPIRRLLWCGARPVIGSANANALPRRLLWQAGKISLRRTKPRCRRRRPLPIDWREVHLHDEGRKASTAGAQLQTLQARGDVESDLALHAERLQRDRVGRAADQHVAAEADADRGRALRAGIVAREITDAETRD